MTDQFDIWAGMPESTGSPRGVHTIAREHECGRAVWYSRQNLEEGEAPPEDKKLEDKLDPLYLGSCFHWLCRARPDLEHCITQKTWNAEQVEATRLYKHAVTHDYFGGLQFISYEVPFQSADDILSPEYFTGQADGLAVTTDERFNLSIGTAVCVDFKTARSVNLASHYLRSPQAHLYLARLRETKQAEAIIFLEITKHKRAENIVISRHTLQSDTWPMNVLKQWARDGSFKVFMQKRNLAACIELDYGRGCPFYGRCMADALEENKKE